MTHLPCNLFYRMTRILQFLLGGFYSDALQIHQRRVAGDGRQLSKAEFFNQVDAQIQIR